MSSHIIDEFESEYSKGEFQELTTCILPFLQSHWEDLRPFIDHFAPLVGDDKLDTIIKLFILHYNMPFDMALYMKLQKQFIEQTVNKDVGGLSPEERREAVSNWIRENAQKHRHEAILKQVLCFEKMKDQIVPIIHKALQDGTTPSFANIQ